MRLSLLLFVSCVLTTNCFSQKEYNNWYFGDGAAITFNYGAPQIVSGNAEYTNEGTSSISDKNGNLLFYTDGGSVWDNTNAQMPNGSGLLGCYSATQSALILPQPGSTTLYYVFTSDCEEDSYIYGYQYSIVDMSMNNGKGDVTATKNVPLYSPGSEKLTAVLNAAGNGYWIITHELNSNHFINYELTASGLSAPVVSAVGYDFSQDFFSAAGYIRFSNDKQTMAQLICTEDYFSYGTIELYSFNNTTGKLTYRYGIGAEGMEPYGAAFSPDDTKLYVSETDLGEVDQYDATANNDNSFYNSLITVAYDYDYQVGAILQGPDNRLYVAEEGCNCLSIIDKPNLLGYSCNYLDASLSLGAGTCIFGLPNFAPGLIQTCNAAPVTINADKITFCPTDSAHICAPSGYTSYLWNSGESVACIKATQTGQYFVSVKDINNCSAVSDTISVTATPLPAPLISADKNLFCAQDSAQICVNGTYASYAWNEGSTNSCTHAKTAGDYYVTVTDVNGCTAQSSHTSVNVYPVSSVSIIERGDTLTSYGAQGYQWYFNGSPISGATQPQYIAAIPGDYSLAVTDTNSCTTQSEPVQVATTGLKEVTGEVISVYPNPSAGSWQLAVGSEYMGSKLQIYDDEGRIVFESEISNLKSELNLPLSKGIYYLQISAAGITAVKKLVKM